MRWLLAAIVVMAAAVALGLVTPGALDRTAAGGDGRAGAGAGEAVAGERTQPMLGPAPQADPRFARYGRVPEPAGERVRVRMRKRPKAALLFDVRTGRVLWSLHPRRTRSVASLTKMMTAILTTRHEDPHDMVRITRVALNYRGSGVGLLKRKKRFEVETLLYGLMLPSGNDAARALAVGVSGSLRRFVNLMNAEARRLGLRCTHFTGPDGYDPRNRSCARDLAVLARMVLDQPRLRRIVRSRKAVRRAPVKGRRLYLYGHNPLMRLHYPHVTGVKTGYTDEAGRCFVGTARRGDVHLGVVLLDSPDTGGQARTLLNRGFRALSVRSR